MITIEETQASGRHLARAPRWRRGWLEGARCALLRLPGGIVIAVVPIRAIRPPHRRLWDLWTRSAANPCDDRGFRCTSRTARRHVVSDELYRLGWPA